MSSHRRAVLLNPLSGRVRRHPEAVRALAHALGPDGYAEASDPLTIAQAVAGLDLGEADILCVVAGDGTLHAVLTALERTRPAGPWPTLAVAPGGTTNMAARDLGPAGKLLPWLRALRNGPGRVVSRPALRIGVPKGAPMVGLLFGAGTVSAGVEFFNRRLRPLGIPEAVGSPIAVARTLVAMSLGGSRLDRLAPRVSVRVNGEPALDGPALLLAASTLDRVILGARPFWGTGDGPLHVTVVERAARDVFRSVPRVIFGRPGPWMTPERGWHSHDTPRLELAFDAPYIVDGELYHARAADGPLTITATRAVRWWTP